MSILARSLVLVSICATILAAACGGDSKKTATPTAPATSTVAKVSPSAAKPTAGASTAAGATSAATTVSTSAAAAAAPSAAAAQPTSAAAAPPPPPAAADTGKTYTSADATKILNAASLLPADIGADWSSNSDSTTDNATAAATDPVGGASFARCGRLLGRTVVSAPKDVVTAFLTAQPVTMFSTLTAYATAAGAADCSAEAAVRYQQPGEFAKAFGSAFVDPSAVVVVPVDYPQFADGSFAARLTGKVNANGAVVDISILVIAFRRGNVSGAIGVAYSAGSIDPATLTPDVTLIMGRLAANQ